MKVWMSQLRRGVSADDIVAAISALLKTATGEDRYQLAMQLDPFLTMANRDREALQLIDELMREFPEDVLLPMRKATIYLSSEDNFEEALKWIDVALERAYRAGCFRREALGYKARILLELGRGEDLSDVLEKIMSLKIAKGELDIGRERDFVDRAPPGLIRKDVLDRYNAFRPRRAGDTTADEPPEFESPDDAM